MKSKSKDNLDNNLKELLSEKNNNNNNNNILNESLININNSENNENCKISENNLNKNYIEYNFNNNFNNNENENNNENNYNKDELDNILLKLNIISQLKENDKLVVNNNDFKIDNNNFQFVKRWYYSENRENTLNKLNEIIDITFKFIENNHINKILQRILFSLKSCINGINSLKLTYKNDVNIITKIDLLIENINIKINEIELKFNLI